jgi:hypothetical protein
MTRDAKIGITASWMPPIPMGEKLHSQDLITVA